MSRPPAPAFADDEFLELLLEQVREGVVVNIVAPSLEAARELFDDLRTKGVTEEQLAGIDVGVRVAPEDLVPTARPAPRRPPARRAASRKAPPPRARG